MDGAFKIDNNHPLVHLSRPAVVTCAGIGLDALRKAVVNACQNGIIRKRAVNGKEYWTGSIEIEEKTDKIHNIAAKAVSLIADEIDTVRKRYGAKRMAVCIGSCDNGSEASFEAHKVLLETGKMPVGYTLKAQGAGEIASYVAALCKAEWGALSFATACSSSSTAIMRGAQLLLAGEADAVIAGGIDLASGIALLGFDSLKALSPYKSNPFSINRCGITLGDGAALFVMTRERCGAQENVPDVVLAGMGESTDAHHMTSPDETGEYAALAMTAALNDAMLSATDVDYVNLHGTGTSQNDAMESRAMQKVFGERTVLCSSTKSVTGHTLGAAGAVEAAVCYAVLMMNGEQEMIQFPAQAWDGEEDDRLPHLHFVEKGKMYKTPGVCMTNTFAFGGMNASMILSVCPRSARNG